MGISDFEAELRNNGWAIIPANSIMPASSGHIATISNGDFLAVLQNYAPKECYKIGKMGGANYYILGYRIAIQTTVNATATGDKMPIDIVSDFFKTHHTIRKFTKATVFFALGWIVANAAEIQASIPAPYNYMVVPLIFALDNWLKHNTTLPLVGAKAKSKSR